MSFNTAAQPLQVWAVDAMTRVGPTDPVGGSTSVAIWAGRNDWEAFQIVVSARGANVTVDDVSITEFVGPAGATISSIHLYREHYVEVITPTPFSPYPPGFHPDALIPFNHPETGLPLAGTRFDAVPVSLADGSNQPFWIEVYVDADTLPGLYEAAVTVTTAQHGNATIPVTLNVWRFTLPEETTLRSSFGFPYWEINEPYGLDWDLDAEELYPLARRYYDFGLAHRVMPLRMLDGEPWYDQQNELPNFQGLYPGLGTAEQNLVHYVDDMHLNALSIPFWTFWPYAQPLTVDRVTAQAYVAAILDFYGSRGWPNLAYSYFLDLDEPSSAVEYQALRDWGAFFDEVEVQSGHDIPMLATAHPIPPDPTWGTLIGAVDIWVPCCDSVWLSEDYWGTHEIADRLAAGDDVWWYTALAQLSSDWWYAHGYPPSVAGDNPPIWQIDYPPLNYRIATWFAPQYGLTGILYYHVTSWNADPWTDTISFIASGYGYNGDGMLIYPGFQDEIGFDGPVASMRLKWLRESFEDYEIIHQLHELGEGTFAAAQIQIAARDMGDWEEDPAVWIACRQNMGNRLSNIGPIFSDGFESGDTSAWSSQVQ